MSNLSFRFAEPKDANLILQFIIDLAVYEKLEKEVVATPELIQEWIFKQKKAEVLFALEDGKEVGFALFYTTFSTFLSRPGIHLEDLYVKPETRGKGYGKGLLQALSKITVQRGYGRLEWSCLNWNKPSYEFYKSLGAVTMDEWSDFRLSGETLKKLAETN